MFRPLRIFVHSASECLTDHLSHGDGLICHSLLWGLAERGHDLFASAATASIQKPHPRLKVVTYTTRFPISRARPWEYAEAADRHFRRASRKQPFDLVWRMHPYGTSCPRPPATGGRPLVVGPLFYSWPSPPGPTGVRRWAERVKPGRFLVPVAARGWQQTLARARLLIVSTPQMVSTYAARNAYGRVAVVPVIVEPANLPVGRTPPTRQLDLAFVGNLVPNKDPQLYCEIVGRLSALGLNVNARLVGDGPLRPSLVAYCEAAGMSDRVLFLGRLDNQQVYDVVGRVHFLVSTSHGEPYGRGIAEAMAVGTPAVCHRSGGPADLIRDGQNGLLVSERSAAAYADAIAAAVRQGGSWEVMASAAAATAREWRTKPVLDRLEMELAWAVGLAEEGK